MFLTEFAFLACLGSDAIDAMLPSIKGQKAYRIFNRTFVRKRIHTLLCTEMCISAVNYAYINNYYKMLPQRLGMCKFSHHACFYFYSYFFCFSFFTTNFIIIVAAVINSFVIELDTFLQKRHFVIIFSVCLRTTYPSANIF